MPILFGKNNEEKIEKEFSSFFVFLCFKLFSNKQYLRFKKIFIFSIFIFILFFISSSYVFATTKYPTTSGGNWSADATWTLNSDGTANATVAPTTSDDIIFNSSSGSVTVNTTTSVAKTLDMTGSAGTLTITNGIKLSVSGSVTLASGKFIAGGNTAELAMVGTGTLITNGNTLGALTFNGSGQTFTLGDGITTRGANNSGSTVSLIAGTLITGPYTHNWFIFSSWGTGFSRTLNISNSTINFPYQYNSYTWLIDPNTFTSTGSTLNFSGFSTQIGGGTTYNNVNFTGGGTTIFGSSGIIFNNLNITGASARNDSSLLLYGNHTINGIFTLKGGTDNRYRLLVNSSTLGTRRTFTLGAGATIDMQRVDFRDIGFAGPIDLSGITGGSGDALGNNNIIFTNAEHQWFKHTSGAVSWGDSTKWFSDYARTIPGRVPLPQDDVVFDANSFSGTSNLTVNVPRIGRSLNMSAVDDAVTMTLANEVESYGSHILGSNIITAGSYSRVLMGRIPFDFNSYNKSIHSIKVYAFGGTYTNQSNLTLTNTFSATTGTFDFNDYDSLISAIQISNTAEVTLYLGNGTHSLFRESSGNIWQVYSSNVLYSEGSTIKFIPTVASSSNLVFYGSGKIYNKVWFSGAHTGNFDVVGSNSVSEFIIDSGRKVRFTSNTTQQIGRLTALGTALNPITISSITGATHTLNYTGTGNTGGDYLNLSYSTGTPANKWFASHSTNGGNNFGWVFAELPDAPTGLTGIYGDTQASFSWTAPANNGAPITDYVVEYKLTSSPTWSIFADGVSTLTTTTVTGLTNGTSYDFRVSAVNAVGQGTASSTATLFIGSARYARTAGGNWSSNATWSTTSGGSADTTAPTATDYVIFDTNSGNVTVDTTTAVAKTLDMTGSAGTLTITNGMKLSVSGSVTLASGKFTAGGDTAELVMLATGTLITAGNTMGKITFNGNGQTFTLGDVVTTRVGSTVALNTGTLITGPFTHTWGSFNACYTNSRGLNISNSTINLVGDNGSWYACNNTFSPFVTTNSTLNFTGSNMKFYGNTSASSSNYNNLNATGSGSFGIDYTSGTFNNFSRTGTTTAGDSLIIGVSGQSWGLNIANGGTLNLNGGADNRYRLLVTSGTLGARRTITLNSGATTNMQRVDFRDIGFTDSIDLSGIIGGSGDAGGNNNITFNPSRNLYWYTATTGTKLWSNTSGATNWYTDDAHTNPLATGDSPLPQDNVFFNANSIGATSMTISLDVPRAGRDINWTGVTNTPTWFISQAWTMYGSLTLVSDMTFANNFRTTFEGRGSHTITSAGKNWPNATDFNSFGGTYTLGDNFPSVSSMTQNNGTFNANNYNVTLYRFYSTNSNSRTIIMGNGTWSLYESWDTTTTTNLTFSANASTIIFTDMLNGPNFKGGGLTYNNVVVNGKVGGSMPFVGTNIFNNLSIGTPQNISFADSSSINGTFSISAPSIMKVTSGKTITMGPSSSIVATGSAGNLIDIDTVGSTGTWTISRPSGTQNFLLGWLNLNRSVATQANTFFASNTINTGTNTNWVFANTPDAPTAVSTTAGNAQVSLSWSPPGFNGGTAITDYVLEYKLTSDSIWTIFADGISIDTTGLITNLVNGSSYDFRVSAVNGIGQGTASTIVTAIPITVPDTPIDVSATRGNGQASVSFTPPVSNGGSPITSYTVVSNPGNFTGTGNVSPILVTGLTNGVTYTFTVTATNSAGTGPASQVSSPVTPATIPDSPTLPVATAGNGQVALSWVAPVNNGGSPVTDYVIEYKLSSEPTTWSLFADGISSNTNGIVVGLTNGLSYDFKISAVNDVGQGSASIETNAMPVTVPDAPTDVSAIPGNAQASVSFTPPIFNGGSTINSFTVTSSPGNISNTGNASPILVTGLINGVTYTFTVTATNAIGISLPSSPSAQVIPVTVPDAPTAISAVEGNSQATISFTAPLFNGGTPITSYTAISNPGNFTGTGNASPILVTGLTNGVTYTFTVTANNAVGTSLPSSPSNSVTLSTEPGPPVNLATTVLGSSIGLSWSAPISNGGTMITDYVIEYKLTTNGVWAVFADGMNTNTTATVLGLSNRTSYDFRVKAVNIIGESIASDIVSATPGEPAQVLIQNFSKLTVPTIDTAVRITNEGSIEYEYQYTWCITTSAENLCGGVDDIFSASNAKLISAHENFDTTLSSQILVPGNYYFHIKVLYGSESSNAYQSFVALATFPNALNAPIAVAGNKEATVSFEIPTFDGGSAITGYTVTSNPGGLIGTGNNSPIIVSGLTNGTSYSFTITATNIIGTSPASAPSNIVIPMTVPDAPTGVTAVAGDKEVSLSWIASGDGGSPIIDYVVEYKLATESVWLIFADGISTNTSAIVTGLINNLTYDFRISAVNIVGQSNENIINATLPADIISGHSGGGGGGYIKPKIPEVKNEIPILNTVQEVNKNIVEVPKQNNINNNSIDIRNDIVSNISDPVSKESIPEIKINNTNEVKATPTEAPKVSIIPEIKFDNKIKKIILYVAVILGTIIIIGGGIVLFIRRQRNFKIKELGGKKEIENISNLPEKRIKRKI